MIDTGATIPIFMLGDDELLDYFPNAKINTEYNVKLVGVGNGTTDVNMYDIDELILQSGSDKIIFKNFKMACCDKRRLNVSMVLPGCMFKEMNLSFNNLASQNSQVWIEHTTDIYSGIVEYKSNGSIKYISAKPEMEI
jgi:hypothetical protein